MWKKRTAFTVGRMSNRNVVRDRKTWSLRWCVMSGRDYLGHWLIIYSGQLALINLMGGVKVDHELEGVQDESHKRRLWWKINVCSCTQHEKLPRHFKTLQMFRNCFTVLGLFLFAVPFQMTRCQPAATWTWRTGSPTWSRSCSCRRTKSSCSSRLWPTPCAAWAAAKSNPWACSREAPRRLGGGLRPPQLRLRPPKVSQGADEQLFPGMIVIRGPKIQTV